jgi:hypothetical protein
MRNHANKLAILLLFPVACLAQGGTLGGNGIMSGSAQFGAGAGGGTTVAYEAENSAFLNFGTSCTFSITLGGASTTRAVAAMLYVNGSGGPGAFTTLTVGSSTLTLVSGTSQSVSNDYSYIFAGTTSLTGAQTVTITWTTAQYAICGAISATGVNQTTPVINGTGNCGTASPALSQSITSSSGDLTFSVFGYSGGGVTATTNQAQKWENDGTSHSVNDFAYGDIGPGTGTTTHTWTLSSSGYSACISGADFEHA